LRPVLQDRFESLCVPAAKIDQWLEEYEGLFILIAQGSTPPVIDSRQSFIKGVFEKTIRLLAHAVYLVREESPLFREVVDSLYSLAHAAPMLAKIFIDAVYAYEEEIDDSSPSLLVEKLEPIRLQLIQLKSTNRIHKLSL